MDLVDDLEASSDLTRTSKANFTIQGPYNLKNRLWFATSTHACDSLAKTLLLSCYELAVSGLLVKSVHTRSSVYFKNRGRAEAPGWPKPAHP